jgi:hypothetical protein
LSNCWGMHLFSYIEFIPKKSFWHQSNEDTGLCNFCLCNIWYAIIIENTNNFSNYWRSLIIWKFYFKPTVWLIIGRAIVLIIIKV